MPKNERRRYSKPRCCLNWYATDNLMIAKMLSFALKEHEPLLGKISMWHRFEEIYPEIVKAITGIDVVSFEAFRAEVYAAQGKKITPNKLYQRGDKAKRYGEYNPRREVVEQVYLTLMAKSAGNTGLDPRRSFTDDELKEACRRYGHKCPACHAPFNRDNPPQADHGYPHSQGGRTCVDNCLPLCVRCHGEKKLTNPMEFMRMAGMRAARGRRNIYVD